MKGKLEANQAEYRRIAAEKARQAEEQNRLADEQAQQAANAKITKEGQQISKDLYNDMKGIGTKSTFSGNLAKITNDNVAAVVLGYNEVSPDESIAEAILDEVGLGNVNDRVAFIEENIFNKLIAKAEELNINTDVYKEEFAKAKQSTSASAINNKNFDRVLNGLASAINGHSILTKTDKQDVANMTPAEQQEQTIANLDQVVVNSQKALDGQLEQDGWAGKTVDWMSQLWGSENRKEIVQKDLDAYKEQVDQLKNCKTEAEFKDKFKEIFGVEYNAEMVLAYQKRSEQQALANATYEIEKNFNDTLKVLLKNDKLTNETQYVQTSSGMYGATGNYVETATKEQVYEREFNSFAEFIGNGNIETGKAELETAFKEAGLGENATIDEKYQVLHELAKDYSSQLHDNVMLATENKGYDAFTKECEAMYNAAFGLTNDIAHRVQDYNISQQAGAMILKSTAKAAGTIGLCLIPGVGVGLAAVGTTAISAGVDISDRATSKVGLQDGEIETILKNAAVDGATVLAGGGITKMLKNASTFAKLGGQFVGDVATGAAAEKIQTGTITLGGVAFQCVFSAAGNLVSLKQLKNAGQTPKVDVNEPQNVRVSKGVKGDVNNYRDAIADAEVARNIDQSHLNENGRRMVADGLEDVPTPQEVDAFQKSLGEAPTPEQKVAIDANNRAVAEANAEAHQIGNNLSDADLAKLKGQSAPAPNPSSTPEIVALENDIKGIEGTIKKLEQQIAGAKKMGKNTTQLQQQIDALQGKLAGKRAELKALTDTPVEPPKPDGVGEVPKVKEAEVAQETPKPDEAGEIPVNNKKHNVNIEHPIFKNGKSKCNMTIDNKNISIEVAYMLDDTQLSKLRELFENTDDINKLIEINDALLNSNTLKRKGYVEQLERVSKFSAKYPVISIKRLLNHEHLLVQNDSKFFEEINTAFYGDKSQVLQDLEIRFDQECGVKIHFQNDLPDDIATDIITGLQKKLKELKPDDGSNITDIYFTDLLIENKADGYFLNTNNTKNANTFVVLRNTNISNGKDYLVHTYLHERVHLSDMNAINANLKTQPIGTKLVSLEDKKFKIVYDDALGNKLTDYAKKYISDYSATDLNEFKAEFGSMLLERKISIEEVTDEFGNISCKIKVPDTQFTNIDGTTIIFTDTDLRNLQELTDYYFSVGGKNYSLWLNS